MKDEIRRRLDFRELVSEHVALKPAGRDKWKGLSPFTKEKTPSFYVDTAKGLYYCFSTRQGGDAFDFLMKVEGIDFHEALVKLAARTGVEIETRQADRHKRDLYEVNRLALEYYRKCLADVGPGGAGSGGAGSGGAGSGGAGSGGAALEYLRGRGVSDESLERFELGWAPAGFDGLLKHAKARGVGERELLEAGLLAEAPDTGRVYDRFRARVMFPIRDYLGRVVSFGGRVLDDSKPKYLNGPETEVFRKSDTLYGLDLARKAIQDTGEAVVVEGYMDVIALHQHGFGVAVASLGTALTPDHAHLLARQGTRRLALLFDNDAAGERATLAGLDQEIGRMFLVRAVSAPGGKDAADILLAPGGRDVLERAIAGGLSEVEYRFTAVLERFDPGTLDGKRGILQALLPSLRPRDVFDPVATELRRLVIDRLGIEPKRLDEWVGAQARPRGGGTLDRVQAGGLLGGGSGRGEIRLAQLLVQNPALTAKLDGDADFENPLVAELVRVARTSTSSESILEHFRGRPEMNLLLEGLFRGPQAGDGKDNADELAVDEITSRRREQLLRQDLKALKARVADAAGDELVDLLRACDDLHKAIEAERRARLRV